MTSEETEEERRRIARTSIMYAFFVLAGFLVAGNLIFAVFGITLGAFQVGGGILLLLIGLNMIFEKPSSKDERRAMMEKDAEKRDSITLVPLAIPLLAGPGTITTVLVLKASAPVWYFQFAVLLAILLACLLVYMVYISSRHINRRLGRMGINAVTRIMALILIAIAVQMGTDGIKRLFFSAPL